MGILIISQSAKIERMVDGRVVPTIAFLGAIKSGARSQLGIGIMFPERGSAYFWGHLDDETHPHTLIASWRGWKILEKISTIGDTTLCACLACGQSIITPEDQKYVQLLYLECGDSFYQHWDEVSLSLPTIGELVTITDVLGRNGIHYSAREVVREYAVWGVELPKHFVKASHTEPAKTVWERCTQIAYNLFQ